MAGLLSASSSGSMTAMTQARPPAAACSRQTCEGCEIRGRLLCVHTPRDLADFVVLFVVWAVPFLAGMVIGRFWIGLAVWGGLALLFFGYVEQLVLCRHCPHYAERGFFLRCHANWGLPKIPRFNPRPMNRPEGVIWLLYGAVLFLYYVPFFVISQQWLLLGITTCPVRPIAFLKMCAGSSSRTTPSSPNRGSRATKSPVRDRGGMSTAMRYYGPVLSLIQSEC